MPAHAPCGRPLRARRHYANSVVRSGVRSMSAGYRLWPLLSNAEGRSIQMSGRLSGRQQRPPAAGSIDVKVSG